MHSYYSNPPELINLKPSLCHVLNLFNNFPQVFMTERLSENDITSSTYHRLSQKMTNIGNKLCRLQPFRG